MKKVYRVLCLALAMVMLLSVSSVMAESKVFSDVKETGKYSEAIYTLTDFGIIKGDAGADTFRPEADISREEFSVIMTRFLGVENLAVNTSTYPFNDVTPETCADWSIKATKIAYDMGIISGYGDGNFGPKDPVTYEQAVKMIVCALGYENAAVKMGGWPTGYLTVAINNKITTGAEYANSQPAPRQIIAQLIYNALEVNRVSSTATDPNEKITILSEVLKLTKGKGVVTANGTTSVDSTGSSIKEDQIEIDVAGVTPRPIFNAGTTNAADYLGKQVNFFYREENGENVLASVRPTNSNKTLTFEAEYIKSISSSKVEIYDDPDDTTEFEEYTLSSPKVIYNEKYYSGTIDSTLIPTFGSITLMDYTGDGKYDIINIKDTRIFVVSTVNTAQNLLYNLYDQTSAGQISIAPSSQRRITVTKGGQPSNVSAIKVNDVLLVAESLDPSKSVLNIEIVANQITGKVTACNVSEGLFTIAGKTYEAANAYMTYAASSPISIGDEVNFWINDNDIILYAEVNSSTATSSYSYGYLLGAENKTTGATTGTVNVNLFTSSGKETTYKLASNVSINGVPCTTPSAALSALDAANDVLDTNNDKITNLDSPTGLTTYCQLIKYVVNTAGEISIILTPEIGTGSTFNVNKLTRATKYNSTAVKYSTTSGMLGNVLVDNSTIIFYVPTDRDDTDDYIVDKTSSLTTSLTYNFESYDKNEGVAKVIVVYGSNTASATSPTAPVIIVSDIRETVNKESDVVHQVTGFRDGSEVTYKAINRSVLSGFQAGDVLTVAFDSAGDISDAKLLYSASSQVVTTSPTDYSLYMGGDNAGTVDAEFMTVSGTVAERYNTQMLVAVNQMVDGSGNLDTSGNWPVKFSSGTIYYIFNPSNGKFTTGTYADIYAYDKANAGASKVFSFSSRGETKFVLIVNP